MFSNLQRFAVFMLLASAACRVLAAPAPVLDLNSSSSPTVSGSETEVQRLERLLNNRNQMQLQMQQQMDGMAEDIQTLRGLVETNTHEMQQMVQRQRELFVELDRLRSDMKVAESNDSENKTKSPSSTGTFSENANEQKSYQDAVDLILKKRDYAGAIAAFNQFQHDFPKSNFAPNAHYWLGQLYFAQQQDDKAIESFKAVLTFKQSNKRADALVKLGDIEKRRKNKVQANKYYQQVIDEYPDSASAKSAQRSMMK